MQNLTAEGLVSLYHKLNGTIWYGVTDALTPGKMLFQEARPGYPLAIYCHPDDLERLKAMAPGKLYPLSEWRPSDEDVAAMAEEFSASRPIVYEPPAEAYELRWVTRFGPGLL